MSVISQEEFKKALPDKLKKSVTQDMVKQLNYKLTHPEMFEVFRENTLGFTHVLKEGRFKMTSYLDAVKYVSWKLAEKTNGQAYALTFPDKVKSWIAKEMEPKDMASYVAAYNKSKLVKLLLEQTLMPTHILNRDLYQKALNRQAHLMMNARSEKVQSDAANSLISALKPPETKKIELEISEKEDSTIDALRESTAALVAQQREMLQAGMINAQQAAKQPIIINQGPEQE